MKTMKTQTLPAELVASSLFLLKRLGMTAKQRSVDEYERLGLNPYHHAILALLEGSAPETQAEIADALGYDRGTLVGLLDELEEQKLVERKRDPDDRRRHLVRGARRVSAATMRSPPRQIQCATPAIALPSATLRCIRASCTRRSKSR